jgi:hypothetical protein
MIAAFPGAVTSNIRLKVVGETLGIFIDLITPV